MRTLLRRSTHVVLKWILQCHIDRKSSQLQRLCPGLVKDPDVYVLSIIITSVSTMLDDPHLDVVVSPSDHLSGIHDRLKSIRAIGNIFDTEVDFQDLLGKLGKDPLKFWVQFGERVILVDGKGVLNGSDSGTEVVIV